MAFFARVILYGVPFVRSPLCLSPRQRGLLLDRPCMAAYAIPPPACYSPESCSPHLHDLPHLHPTLHQWPAILPVGNDGKTESIQQATEAKAVKMSGFLHNWSPFSSKNANIWGLIPHETEKMLKFARCKRRAGKCCFFARELPQENNTKIKNTNAKCPLFKKSEITECG